MCKHILINNFTPKDLKIIKEFNELTCENDGYGAIIRYKCGKIDTLKALNIASFYIELTRKLNGSVQTLVIHHRTSTNRVGLDYCHPFEHRGYYLTHNGVVRVPKTYKTKTTNDSEQLLHHLIDTNFDTVSIEGYFSVFLLNKSETIVLVDDIAPLYTDNRIYSSHKLKSNYERVVLKKITLDTVGHKIDETKIQTNSTGYGLDKAYLSLGTHYYTNDNIDMSDYDDTRYNNDYEYNDDIIDFYNSLKLKKKR